MKNVAIKRESHSKHTKEQENITVNQKNEKKANETKIQGFIKKFHESGDLEDHLQELSDFIYVILVNICFRSKQKQQHVTLES